MGYLGLGKGRQFIPEQMRIHRNILCHVNNQRMKGQGKYMVTKQTVTFLHLPEGCQGPFFGRLSHRYVYRGPVYTNEQLITTPSSVAQSKQHSV